MSRKKKTDEPASNPPMESMPVMAEISDANKEAEASIADDIRQTPRELVYDQSSPPVFRANPYRAVFSHEPSGIELGENFRYRQRVLKFRDKPDEQTIAALKDAGFRYRAEEKSWTIQANPESRYVSDQLAQQFAGDVARSR